MILDQSDELSYVHQTLDGKVTTTTTTSTIMMMHNEKRIGTPRETTALFCSIPVGAETNPTIQEKSQRSIPQRRRVRFSNSSNNNKDGSSTAITTHIKVVDRVPEVYKESLWYNAQDLSQIYSQNVQETFKFHLLRTAWMSATIVEASMENRNLSWRGLERVRPVFLGGNAAATSTTTTTAAGGAVGYVQTVLDAVAVVQMSRSLNDVENKQNSIDIDISNSNTCEDDQKVADLAMSLSQPDRQRASNLGQLDAMTAQDLHNNTRKQPPQRLVAADKNSYNYNGPSLVMLPTKKNDITQSLVLLFVFWLVLVLRISLVQLW